MTCVNHPKTNHIYSHDIIAHDLYRLSENANRIFEVHETARSNFVAYV